MPGRGERSYADDVWEQFRRNRAAYCALWAVVPMFGLAILAPIVCSNQPFLFWDGDQWLFPWLRALFVLDEPVNYLFNMGLLASVPWAIWLLVEHRNRSARPPVARGRLPRDVGRFLLLTVLIATGGALPVVHPGERYRQRNFQEEEFASGGHKYGIYPPIPFGPIEQDLEAIYEPPLHRKPLVQWKEANDGAVHWLGTDNTGRDVVALLIYGARISLSVGLVVVALYLAIGGVVGAVAGYFGGWVDLVVSRAIEVVLLFPAFFLILTLVALIGPSIYIVMLVMGITGWPTIARLVRGEVLKQRALDYITAARALGASHTRILFGHLLPNALGPALVAAPFGVANAVMTEAGLSLLGFGVRPPTPSWGAILQLGTSNYHHWWLVVCPSLAIFALVTLFNLLGSGLRDALDPKLRR